MLRPWASGAIPGEPNDLWIWTSDWHVPSDDAEAPIVGDTKPTDAAALVEHINSLNPAGVIDTGDCKDHYGPGTGDELDNYVAIVRDGIERWGEVNPGASATHPILPGNHDEVQDSGAGSGTATDFSLFDARFWSAPYHWSTDWPAAQVRFIGIHAAIIHDQGGFTGFFTVAQAETDWLEDELAALPGGWKAIVCCHAPLDNAAFGNGVHDAKGGSALRAVLAANSAKVAACLNGHRHSKMATSVLAGIRHISGPGVSYYTGDARGGFVPITHADGVLTFDCLQGPPSGYGRVSGYTPITVEL